MHPTVIRLTARATLGGRRLYLLLTLSLLLVILAIGLRLLTDIGPADATSFLQPVALGTLLPLFGLIVGTGVVAPEIDDGSIVYLLSKPVGRARIIRSKLLVAVVVVTAFAALPTFLAALIMTGDAAGAALALGAGALVAGAVYSALFLLLAVITRHAVVIGLVYALVWEALVGGFVPGARNLSIHQWSLSVAESVSTPAVVSAEMGLGVALVLIVAAFVGATWLAGVRLRRFALTGEE